MTDVLFGPGPWVRRSIVKFIASVPGEARRARPERIASTLFGIFTVVGCVAYIVFLLLAFNIRHVVNITPDQNATARSLMLVIGIYVSLGFPFSIFGGVINGFQRYDLNNVVGIASSVVVAIANVAMLLTGCTLVQLVTVTTGIRILTYFVYRLNAYHVFPLLRIRPSLFLWSRVRELTELQRVRVDHRLGEQAQLLDRRGGDRRVPVAGAVAIWTVPQRLAEMVQRLTNQLNGVLFPVVVDSDTMQRTERLQKVNAGRNPPVAGHGVVQISVAVILLARPFILAWVGPNMLGAVPVMQILALTVAIRVGNASATTLLKGAGRVRYLATANIVAGLVNLLLSVLLVKPLGLVGVALGTLMPIAAVSGLVIFPVACQRVDVSVPSALRHAVWQASWPALVMTGCLVLTQRMPPARFWL